MDLSTRRRNAMDKPQMNPNQTKPQHRSSRVSASPSRPTHAKKQLPSNQRRTEVSSAASPSSPAKEAQNSLKKSGSNRVFIDSSRSPFADYHPSDHSEIDYAYDSEDSYGLSSSPSHQIECFETVTESQISAPVLRQSSNGNKKAVKSGNHLLNFSFPARERPTATSYKSPKLPLAPFKRERFVQSNFRFIVSKDGEYSENVVDPDAVIDWELVEFVLCPQVDEEMTCCICLESPTCPRIAKCGHIFCWSCILHLYSYHEHTSLAPCPVCLREKIRLVDLRPVIIEKLTAFKNGDPMEFTLIQRPKHLNLLYPATVSPILDSKRPLPNYDYEAYARFNRLVVTNSLLDLFTTDSIALEAAIADAKSSQDLTLYLELAHQMLKEEMSQLTDKTGSGPPSLQSSSNINMASSTGLLSPITKPLSKHKLSDLMPESLSEADCYFFYQSSDGQQIFLHPLSRDHLAAEYGVDAFMPPLLQNINILDLETKTFDEKARRKFPALSHLPISCQYHFALVDVSPFLNDPVRKAQFLDDVKHRREAIERATARELRRAEIYAQQIAAKQLEQQQKLYAARYKHSQYAGPDLVPPDLNDASFPEINAIRISGTTQSPNAVVTPHATRGEAHGDIYSAPRPSSAWDKGTLISTLHKPTEEAFPVLSAAKEKPGVVVLNDDLFHAARPVASSSGAWGAASSAPVSPTPNAWASRASGTSSPGQKANSSSTGNASTTPKKKQGKKTILVI